MSPHGRPKGEYRSALDKGTAVRRSLHPPALQALAAAAWLCACPPAQAQAGAADPHLGLRLRSFVAQKDERPPLAREDGLLGAALRSPAAPVALAALPTPAQPPAAAAAAASPPAAPSTPTAEADPFRPPALAAAKPRAASKRQAQRERELERDRELREVLAPRPPRDAAAPVLLAALGDFSLGAASARKEPVRASGMVTPAATAPGRFDLQVNNAPAAQVFMQLGQGSTYNMLVAPEVAGSISVTLRDTSLMEALEALRELFGYDYRVSGNRVYVMPNTVQTRLFRVNYLQGRRQGISETRVTSSAISQAAATGSGNGNNTGSGSGSGSSNARADDSSHVRTTSDADFWREVQASLSALVGAREGRSVVMNMAAGVIVVKATPNELRQVEQFLKAVQVSIDRQVMLEAKIVEVQLSKDAQTGINWSSFGRAGSGTGSIGMAAPGSTLGSSGSLSSSDGTNVSAAQLISGSVGRGFYGLAFQSANFAALLNFLQTQGNVQVLSSPRIATLNNQKAVLKVGSDELYVTGVSTTTTANSSGGSTSSPSLTLQPFFSGIALDVTPQIDDAGNVMLHIHPSVSTVAEKTKNVDLGALGAYKLPLAASTVNETDSIVRVRDGQIVAIGGLMKQETRDERTGLPVVQDAPLLGGLFRQTATVTTKRELVIILKPTIIQDGGAWPDSPTAQAPTN